MRNDDILYIVNAFQAIKGKEMVDLPAAVAWKRRLNLKELIKAYDIIDEALKEVGEKYDDDEHSEKKTVKDSDGNEKEVKVVKPDFINEYVAAQKEILMQNTEVTIRKIKIEDLGDVMLSDEMMDTIEFMIED